MALNSRVDPWIGDQRRRVVQAREEAILDRPISHDPVGETPEQVAERQKRRDAIGKRYLEGQAHGHGVPFIMSAKLKGPFEESRGWKNPWLPKKPAPRETARPLRPLQLQGAFRDNPSLTGRQRNGSVASTRSNMSTFSVSQNMAADRLNSVRQQPVRPNLHGGLKHFLGTASGATPSSTSARKLDRENLPQLPPLKRKADISWLKGADIVKKKRRDLPDLPSPTPPSRMRDETRQIITPTNLLDRFRQQGQQPAALVTPRNKRPAITSSQTSTLPHFDIPTPSQVYSPPFKKQRRSLLAAQSPDSLARKDTGSASKNVMSRSKLGDLNKRSTSDRFATQADRSTQKDSTKSLAARVRSLNDSGELAAVGSFIFRRTRHAVAEIQSEDVLPSTERDDDDNEDITITNGDQEAENEPARTQMEKRPLNGSFTEIDAQRSDVPDDRKEPHLPLARDADEAVVEKRVRNSQYLPSGSETVSPEKVQLPIIEEQLGQEAFGLGTTEKFQPLVDGHELSSSFVLPEAVGQRSFSSVESPSQAAGDQLPTIPEVTETTSTHADVIMPTMDTCTMASEHLVMEVVQDEMLHDDEGDTTMPDIPQSTSDSEDNNADGLIEEPVAVEEVAETTYVQMASGSISVGSLPTVSQSTAMNTQTIEAIKANLEAEEDDDEDIMAPAPESSSSPEDVVPEEEDSSGQSQYAQRQDRPQISSSTVLTDSATSSTHTQQSALPPAQSGTMQQSNGDVTVDDILRIMRSSQREQDSSHEKTRTQTNGEQNALAEDTETLDERQMSSKLAQSWQDSNATVSSFSHSQAYSHLESPLNFSQVDAVIQSQSQSQLHSQDRDPGHLEAHAQGVVEDSSIPTNTGTTTTESLLLQAVAQDMAREDDDAIEMTGLTESTNDEADKEDEATPKHSLSQKAVASVVEEQVLVEKSSNELPQYEDSFQTAAQVLQEPETQSWHISIVEDSTMADLTSGATEEPPSPTRNTLVQSNGTGSPQPSMVPASVEEAPLPAVEAAPISLSDNPWAIGTQATSKSTPVQPASVKRVTFSDHPSSSSVDDDDLDRPQRPQHLLPSSPPPRIVPPTPLPVPAPPPPIQQEILFSPPPVYREPPSTESPFPIIIKGLRNRLPQPQAPASSQGVGGMANAFLAADTLAPIREAGCEETLSPPSRMAMAPRRQGTPPPQSDAITTRQKIGQSSVARELAMLYPSSSEADPDSPIRSRQSRSRSRQVQSQRQESQSPTFASQEQLDSMVNPEMEVQQSSPPPRPARIQVSRSPSTIMDPYANPWCTQPAAPPSLPIMDEEGEEEDYDELPPFSLGGIMGMLGEGFGSGRPGMSGREGERDEGVGQVADEMSDLLEEWDVDVELSKARREDVRSGKGGGGESRSSARERVGWGRF